MAKQTKAQLKAKERYNKANTITYCLRLNKNTDQDIIEILNSVGSKTGYIKELIRMDINLEKQIKILIDNQVD